MRRSATTDGYPSIRLASYVLAVLMIAGVVSLLDRQIMILLVEPIQRDLGITDTQISLLQGLAFAIFYCFAGLPLGQLADRVSRKKVMIFGIVTWSAATIGCGAARTFEELFFARVMVGFGEACLNPCAYSLMSDYFAPHRRGRAYGLFGGASSVGAALSLFLGSAVLSTLGAVAFISLPLVGTLATWKVVFIIAGLPGLMVALLLLTVPEPHRRETAVRHAEASSPKALAFLRENAGVIIPLLVVYALWSMAGYGYTAWMATGYVRTYGLSVPNAGVLAGIIITAGSLVGAYVGGVLGDRWSSGGAKGGKLRVTFWASAIAAVTLPVWWLLDSPLLSVLVGCLVYSCGAATLTSAPAALNELVPNELRGRMSAIYLLVTGIVGISFGPAAVALATDFIFADRSALNLSMIVVPGPAIVASGCLAWALQTRYSGAVARRRAEFAVSPGETFVRDLAGDDRSPTAGVEDFRRARPDEHAGQEGS